MKKIAVLLSIGLFYVLGTFFFLDYLYADDSKTAQDKKEEIYVFPEAGRAPWLDIINGSQNTLNIAAYKLSDPSIIEALSKACQRGVQINLLIQPEPVKNEQSLNIQSPIEKLKETGIKVFTLSPRFNQAHYKMITADDRMGLISTGNLDAESFDGVSAQKINAARDFSVCVKDAATLHAMNTMFLADIQDKRRVPDFPKLVWGPDQQRSTFLRMINGAQNRIDIYQQDFQDVGIAQAVAGAARAGVNVRIIMMPFPFSKTEDKNIPNQTLMTEAGVKVGLNTQYYIHAKVIIVDGKEMYIGSGNFYTPSLDQTRELGILIHDLEQIQIVADVFEEDWKKSTLFKS